MSCILVADEILAHFARSATRLRPLAENPLPPARRIAAELRKANIETLLTTLMQSGQEVSAVHIYGHWNDIDDEASLLAEAEQPTIA